MRLMIIGSAPAVWGFSLAGVPGRVVGTEEELDQALDDALEMPDLGIVLVTQDVAAFAPERIGDLMARSELPLVVEIPGPEGPSPDAPSITDMLRRTIGVKV